MKEKNTAKPWYRERGLWLLMMGPIIVVIAGLITFRIAVMHGDTLVSDDYYKEGQNIQLQLERDEEALKRNIVADVLVSPKRDFVRVVMDGDIGDSPLQLLWIHPTIKRDDQTVALKPEGQSGNKAVFVATFKPLENSNYWYLRIEDIAHKWRIEQKWIVSQGNRVIVKPINELILPRDSQVEGKVNGQDSAQTADSPDVAGDALGSEVASDTGECCR